MRKSNLRATAGWQALAILGAGAFIASPAAAQEASNETQPTADQQAAVANPEDQADGDDAIVVTGSRIVRPDLEAPSPVTTVDSEQFDLTGTVTVETLLNELPQIIPGNTRVSNNQGGESFSTLDLRGLGPQRTLILVDGERVPSSSTTGVVDIGTIPAGLIERVDVVTGGASAVYGSDAMAGVVNFVLKDNYEGMEASAQYGISEFGDAGEFNVQGLVGGNFGDDRGNLTFFASYYTRDAVGQGDRDITRNAGVAYYDYDTLEVRYADHLEPRGPREGLFNFTVSGTNPYGTITSPGNPFVNVGTAANINGTFTNANTDCNPATPGVNVTNPQTLSFNDLGQLEAANSTSFALGSPNLCAFGDRSTGSSQYNFNPLNYLITPYNRWTMAVTGRYDITDNIRLKLVANYVDSSQEVNLAPTPATGLRVDPTLNPFIRLGTVGNAPCGVGVSCHPDLLAALNTRASPNAPFTINRRFVETGPRVGITDTKTATLRGTLSGPLTKGFNWDVTASYGRTDSVGTTKNNINRTATQQGLNGCVANVGTNILPGCVPVDIFGGGTLNNAYPSIGIDAGEMVDFVSVDTKDTIAIDQARLAGNITGNLIELPAGPVGIAVGVEARTDRVDLQVDSQKDSGNIFGFNAQENVKGKVNVKEIYGEVRVPILADMPFFHELSVEGGARYSDYSTVGGLFNWKLGAQWAPIDWLKFRGIVNKAARAPSAIELFQGGDQGFVTVTDRCNDNVNRNAQILAICQAQAPGANFTGFNQTNPQLEVRAFGNPNLSEETATTWTVGAVLTPKLGIGRFSATIDYYNIVIKDVISTFGAGFFINQCYVGNTDPSIDACQRITRDPLTGQVTQINTTVLNSQEFSAKGVDASLNFVVPFSDLGIGIPGRLRIQELLSWTDEIVFDGYDAAGVAFSGVGGTFPEWKSTLTVAYDSDSFTAQLRWNYLGKLEEDVGLDLTDLGLNNTNPTRPALSYFNLSLRKKIGDNFELTGIVDNLFNAKPKRTVGGLGDQGGLDTTYYNPLLNGRYFRISAKVKM
jgi:iron complex outermembrane receptor protein